MFKAFKNPTPSNIQVDANSLQNGGISSIHLGNVFESMQNLSPIAWAFIASLCIHSVVLSLRLQASEQIERLFQNNNLPLILVNVRLKAETNTRAQAVAQTNLSGGGEDNSGRLRSPLPSARKNAEAQDNEDLQLQESSLKSLEAEQAKLLAQVRAQISKLSPTQPLALSAEQESKRQRLIQMLAEIEDRIEQNNKRPHTRYFSPSTRESEFAVYYDQMRQKIESYGTQHFPTVSGRKIYGALTMTVIINSRGQVLSAQVLESSGHIDLDRRAQAIVMSSGPFAAFTPALLAKADQLALVSRFSFKENGVLDAEQR